MEFHVSRAARERYQFDETLFSTRGSVIIANFHAARVFAQRINDQRDVINFPERAVSAGQINAMGLIDEILHMVIDQYRQQKNPQVIQQALEALDQRLGSAEVDRTLRAFADEFPPVAVYRGDVTLDEYMSDTTDGVAHREIVLEEMLMLWLANANPAYQPFLELFDDATLEAQTPYQGMIDGLHEFFDSQPGFGPRNESLLAILRSPALAMPNSLAGQLEFLLGRWSGILGSYLYRLLSSLDLIKEEEKMVFIGAGGPGGGGPVEVYSFTGQEHELERFTPDRDWMPRLVLIAKNAFVWLDQLSKKYQRPIHRLDQIPDQELDTLARWGITGLWLIGLWERSTASKTIKQLMGNQDAVASAYSLLDYQIAADLGGDAAVEHLKARAWQRGIRLASDMVPNHTGIDGRWVIEHPEWFIKLDYSPYPSYSFNGPDLSWDERIGIFLEDHYYDRSDAAVVFKRVDRWSGEAQYIYHGNDGTSMPWNDTAQINYLHPEAREAVIQTILHVARQFPVIRFDAAMTLAKRHIQRLWFPEPGSGGAIASRSEFGITKAQFDALMPHEFWREVVDRAAVEAPDTLLLAEAFWLMEGYFVRTLGMHRVYNSAFMNLLRDEENAKYRQVMKNTLEFDPEILKRFVNFMNNPDERTAVEQFGKDDKYFGICTVMVTMPGLPMFGHGQVEGFTEKYGMEYRRAYWDEQPDSYLIQRHEREIFPLLHRRYLFAAAEHFLLYDCYMPEGGVNEDVFAYSNRFGDDRTLVLYHNRYATTRGWIKTSVAYSVKNDQGGDRRLVQRTLGDGLALNADERCYYIFRDQISGLEYLRSGKELYERGLYIELGAYQHHVFMDFREVFDTEWGQYAHLAAQLGGRGVPSIEEAQREIFLQPIHQPFKELVNVDLFRRLIDARVTTLESEADATTTQRSAKQDEGAKAKAVAQPAAAKTAQKASAASAEDEAAAPSASTLLSEVESKTIALFQGIGELTGSRGDPTALAQEVRRTLEAILHLPALERRFSAPDDQEYQAANEYLQRNLDGDPIPWSALFGWLFTYGLGKFSSPNDGAQQSRSLIDEWMLNRIIAGVFRDLGEDETAAWRSVALIKLLISHDLQPSAEGAAAQGNGSTLEQLFKDSAFQQLLQVNRYREVLWFNREAFERLLWAMLAKTTVSASAAPRASTKKVAEAVGATYSRIERLQTAAEQSGYQVEGLLSALKDKAAPVKQ
ncbi:MAG TPA: alpha-amylase family glycosyl hydrolase [Herpetosiphonaceae bacterium]